MDRFPATRYVEVGDGEVAYQVLGDGPTDLLWFYGMGNHIELVWDEEFAARVHRSLSSFCRLILFDRRGLGASSALSSAPLPTWEEGATDVAAVLDAVGSERAAIYAALDAGPIAMLFAAMNPERVSGLVLSNTSARASRGEDYPIGMAPEMVDQFVEFVRNHWGTEEFARMVSPPTQRGQTFSHELAKRLRASGTPRSAATHFRYILETLDVRAALRRIQAPTLVLHMMDNPMISVEHGRYLAERIPDARLVEVPGQGMDWDETTVDLMLDEVARFVTGHRPVVEIDRILTTILFTDIVESTVNAARLGDRAWRKLLDDHDHIVRAELSRHRGREIKTTGDGFLACFDGPARAIRCALAISEAVRPLGVRIRAGLHTGECEVRGDDLGGLAVHIAARVGDLAGPDQVMVSSTVKDLVVGSGIEFADAGERALKGVPETWRLFIVEA
ncbi:MAG: adenylate/guanylate cyclase domain-containing protein [Acidimicrobiales bacterium]